jgi:hypothetical protein
VVRLAPWSVHATHLGPTSATASAELSCNRAAQTGVFDLDIRLSNRLFIDVCTSFAAETGLKSRNVEKKNKRCLSAPNGSKGSYWS